MSQNLRENQQVGKDINPAATGNGARMSNEEFEGMNYEQIRKPYNSNNKGRNNSTQKRNYGKRPDEC